MDSSLKDAEEGMASALDFFKNEMRNLRSGRANPGMLDSVRIEVYGTEMKMKELANVSVPEPRQLMITPYDPQVSASIAKGIDKANLGFQAVVDGNVVRVNVPSLTEEMRRDLVKQAKKKGEDAKISVREARRKGNEDAKKKKGDGDITEDEMKKIEKEIQTLTDKFCKEIDELLSKKETEIMEV